MKMISISFNVTENKPISNGKSVKSNPLSESDPKKLAVIQKLRDLQKLLNGCDKKIVQEGMSQTHRFYNSRHVKLMLVYIF